MAYTFIFSLLSRAACEIRHYTHSQTILPIAESRQLLVEIAAAHPSDTWERRAAKAAIQASNI